CGPGVVRELGNQHSQTPFSPQVVAADPCRGIVASQNPTPIGQPVWRRDVADRNRRPGFAGSVQMKLVVATKDTQQTEVFAPRGTQTITTVRIDLSQRGDLPGVNVQGFNPYVTGDV